jgi:hypothetical protein
MTLKLHKQFLAGRYRAAADSLLDGKKPSALSESELASLVGALSFLGQMDEAEALYGRLEKMKASSVARTAGRFFLGQGWTRLSEYERVRKLFARNAVEAGKSALERFYVHQGNAMYAYYTGRYRPAGREAAKARAAAIRSGDLFARAIATDACGHCRVVAGEIHHGLRLLREAKTLAEKMGNGSLANTIAVSLELYDAEFALSGKGIEALEARRAAVGTEDSYSLANVGLEIARLYTRAGRLADAAAELEHVAPAIYAQQNRRQEIKLNLRLAELACRRGDYFSARQSLRFLRRLLHREADSSFELAAVGIERKIALAEGRAEEVVVLTARWKELAGDFGTTRDDNLRVRLGLLAAEQENREDLVHRALQASRQAAADPAAKLRPLLRAGLLCEAASCLSIRPGQTALALLPGDLGLLASSTRGIHWIETKLSSLQSRLLLLLGGNGATKEKLIEAAWGYRYDALRHDAMVYTALSALRKALGPAGELVQATDSGYRLAAPLLSPQRPENMLDPATTHEPAEEKMKVAPPPRLDLSDENFSRLNHRQIEILEALRSERRFLAVGEVCERFAVSEITALRDFDGLRRLGLVVRNGRARATRYSLPGQAAEIGALL